MGYAFGANHFLATALLPPHFSLNKSCHLQGVLVSCINEETSIHHFSFSFPSQTSSIFPNFHQK
jgi:hypothetical protein